jgi:nitrogen fixation/metabolism regulation signal transduction histidine kinase
LITRRAATEKIKNPKIIITVKYNKDFIMLKFEDNGIGIPTEIIDKIYEPYVTSKKTGTGLGLAIVNKIIEEHSGDIEIKNTKPNGVCILITLPLMEIKNG